MRKTVVCLLLIAMLLALCACGRSESADSAAQTAAEPPVEDTPAEPEEAEPSIIEFQDLVLVEDRLVRIELSNFFEKEYHWSEGDRIEKCFTFRVTNKSDKELLIYLEDTYIDNEGVDRSGLDGVGTAPRPGKSDSYSYRIYRKNPAYEHGKPLDSLDELYRLEGSFEICVKEGDYIKKSYNLDFSLPEIFNGTGSSASAGLWEYDLNSRDALAAMAKYAEETCREYSTVSTNKVLLDPPYADDYLDETLYTQIKFTSNGAILILPKPATGNGNLGSITAGTEVTVIAQHKDFYFFVADDGRMGWSFKDNFES